MTGSYISKIERVLDGSSVLFLVLGMTMAVALFTLGA